MRLDELRDKLDEACKWGGVAPESSVTVILDGVDYDYPIDRVEKYADGVRIHLDL